MIVKKWILPFLVIGILGTLSHYVYGWTGGNPVIGLFFPVNESIWEHLKLLFYPTLLYFGLQALLTRQKNASSLPALTLSLLGGMFFITAGYYLISGVIGKNIGWVNIALFFGGILWVLIQNERLQKKSFCAAWNSCTAAIVLLIFAVLFGVFSFFPPPIGLFADPLA